MQLNQIIVTQETLQNANDFMPLEQKTAFASLVAEKCRNAVQIAARDDTQSKALPSMYMENAELKTPLTVN